MYGYKIVNLEKIYENLTFHSVRSKNFIYMYNTSPVQEIGDKIFWQEF